MMTIPSVEQALQEADKCVKCGLCMPHCPTYRLYSDENESPRGRIALAEALLRGQLDSSEGLVDHLYRCLLCRRCETTCPSGVGYAKLIDAARAKAPRSHWASRVTANNKTASLLVQVAQKVAIPGSQLSALSQALPAKPAPKPGRYPARGELRGKVNLFLGCATRLYQGAALHAAITVLTRLGFAVVIPGQQGCCGALAQHQGDVQTAGRQIQENQAAFGAGETLVCIASGCTVQLQETLQPQQEVIDIVSFLQRILGQYSASLPPLQAKAALHLPCSAVNVLRQGQDMRALLEQIPGLELHTLGQPGDCCGAAGDHLLTQRKQAESLRKPLLEQLLELNPDYLVTSNVGCALHLAEGARQQGAKLEVLHPVELLARQLGE